MEGQLQRCSEGHFAVPTPTHLLWWSASASASASASTSARCLSSQFPDTDGKPSHLKSVGLIDPLIAIIGQLIIFLTKVRFLVISSSCSICTTEIFLIKAKIKNGDILASSSNISSIEFLKRCFPT